MRGYQSGFTLPELLVTIVVLIALGGLSVFLLQSKPRDVEMRNAQREFDVALLTQVLTDYYHENGALPDTLSTKFLAISSAENGIDLCEQLVPSYMTDLPFDPTGGVVTEDGGCNTNGQQYHTGYSVKRNDSGTEFTVAATTSEAGKVISLTKHL